MSSRWWTAIIVVAIVVGSGLVIALSKSDSGEGETSAALRENALREIAKEGLEKRQAAFVVEGEAEPGEGERGESAEAEQRERERGPNSPAAQAVADRAYPRTYVNDRLAIKTRKAFAALPSEPRKQAFRAAAQFQAAATSGNWRELGPFHPNVPGEPSQFFDPDTLNGPPTQESGRVSALEIDPACAPGNCRMWVAAAGGGIWRTNDALAGTVQWIEPPNNLPTTAFGSLYFDAPNNFLYAGSG
jgi:hypothetical protein